MIQGLNKDEFAYLSDILGGKGEQFDEDENGLDGGLDDEDLRQDSISTMDMKVNTIFSVMNSGTSIEATVGYHRHTCYHSLGSVRSATQMTSAQWWTG